MILGLCIGFVLGCGVTAAVLVPGKRELRAINRRLMSQLQQERRSTGERIRHNRSLECALRLVAGERTDRILSLHNVGREQ